MKQEAQRLCYLCNQPAQQRCVSCGQAICEQDTRTTWTARRGKEHRYPTCDDQQHQQYISRLNHP